jgi:hypothetical protein
MHNMAKEIWERPLKMNLKMHWQSFVTKKIEHSHQNQMKISFPLIL